MRSLRSTAALLALLVTVGSNVAAPCGGTMAADARGDPSAPAGAHPPHHAAPGTAEGTHAGHHGDAGRTESEDREGAPEHPGQECGILMSCGAAVRAWPAAVLHTAPTPRHDAVAFAAIAEPSAADRTQDPPPPRRHA